MFSTPTNRFALFALVIFFVTNLPTAVAATANVPEIPPEHKFIIEKQRFQKGKKEKNNIRETYY